MDEINSVPVGLGRVSISHRPGGLLIKTLAEMGVSRVVTLMDIHEGPEGIGERVRNAGMAWTWLRVANGKHPQREVSDLLLAGIKELTECLAQGEWVHIHCAAGIHRTGMVTYALLRWNGFEKDAAMEAIGKMRTVTKEQMMEKRTKWGEDILKKERVEG